MKGRKRLSIRVVHVDDNANDRELVRLKFLRQLPQDEMVSCANVEEARDVLRNSPIDVILSDFQMPDTNGLDFLHIVRSEFPDIPFIFLTGQGNESLAAEALRAGADDYYTKDIAYRHFDRLAHGMQALVETWRLQRRHEEMLKERLSSENEFRIVLDNLDQSIAVLDPELRIVHYNIAFAQLVRRFGVHDEIQGMKLASEGTGLPESLCEAPLRALESGRPLRDELELHIASEPLFVEVRCIPIHDDGGVSRVVTICSDHSQFRTTERQLTSTHRDLEQRVTERTAALAEANRRLNQQINESIKATRIQSVLYKIASTTVAPLELTDFYAAIRNILNTLFDTSCFYIAIHVEGTKFRFPYAVDDYDEYEEKVYDLEGGLTNYTFASGQPLIINDRIKEEILGPGFPGIGHPAKIWMGVPLHTDKGIIGVMAVQSYTDEKLYTQDDLDVMNFVSNQIGFAIERKQAEELLLRSHEELERRVDERTSALAVANSKLQKGFNELKRAELVQKVMFFISDATFKAPDLTELLRMIHQRLEELFPVPNIFIALYDHATDVYSFPYFVDAYDTIDIPAQKLKRSLTDFVRRSGLPLLLDPALDAELQRREEIDVVGTPSKSWMGVPLISRNGIIGVMVIQSYTDPDAYSSAELEIMNYVSGQVASAIEHKSAELEINTLLIDMQRQNAELDQLNQELEAFTYTVSHDLRSPLHRISGFTHLVVDEIPPEQTLVHNYLKRIVRACEQMNILIEDLLKFSRSYRSGITPEEVDLSEMAKESFTTLLGNEPERNVEVTIVEGLSATADPALIRIVLDNLFSNALKFTRRTERAQIQFGSMTRDDHSPAYFVKDNGVGFAADKAGLLFTPFLRLHSQDEFEGSGVGLATVARIIERHGGTVSAQGRPGEGATIIFTLADDAEPA